MRKALAIDLDGTLLSSSKEIAAETLSAILELADQGYLVILSTARPVRAVKLALPDWFEEFYWVTCNGAWILRNGQVIHRTEIPFDETSNLAQELIYRGLWVQIEAEDTFYSDREPMPGFVGEYKPLSEYKVGDACKILVSVASDSEISQVRVLLPVHLSMVVTDGGGLIQIARRECGKLNAVKRILEKESIEFENLIAFGDDNNDIDLLDAAGFGVAMENATREVLEIADYVTKSNEEDGVEVEVGKTTYYCLECALQKGYAFSKEEKGERIITFFPEPDY